MTAFIWTALLLFSLPCLASPVYDFHACANASSLNLLRNPSFENEREGWTMDSGKIRQGPAADGRHYLALPRLHEKVLWKANQEVTNLEANKEHTASVSFRGSLKPMADITSAACLIGIVIRNSNSSAFVATRKRDFTKSATNWETLSGTFVPSLPKATFELTVTCLRLRPGTQRLRRVVNIELDDARLEVTPDKSCEGFTGYKAPAPKFRRAVVVNDASAGPQPGPEGHPVAEKTKPKKEPEAAGFTAADPNSDPRSPSENPTKVFSDPKSLPPVQDPKPTATRYASVEVDVEVVEVGAGVVGVDVANANAAALSNEKEFQAR